MITAGHDTISVLLVDDHRVFTQTVARALTLEDDIRVVAEARTCSEALALVRSRAPRVALLDVQLPDGDGIDLCRSLRAQSPETRIVMLTGRTDPSLFPKAMAAGACGFLHKDATLDDVLDGIRRAHAGEIVVPDWLVARLCRAEAPIRGIGSDLTRRELEVLALVAGGSDARSIARALGITWQSARTYVRNVLVKLGAHSQVEAIAIATRLGIIEMRGPE